MRKIFTLLFLTVAATGFSQSVFRPATVTIDELCSEPDIIGHNWFINKFGSPNLRFVRTQNTLSAKWTSAYCDCELCHGVTTDTADFFIAVGDSCLTSAHFYPDNTKGNGSMKIKVFDPKDPANFVLGEYMATCQSVSATFLQKEELSVYPNPTQNRLTVKFGSGEPYVLKVVSVDGKILMDTRVDGLTHILDISKLDTGLYSLQIESTGKVFYSKFVKL